MRCCCEILETCQNTCCPSDPCRQRCCQPCQQSNPCSNCCEPPPPPCQTKCCCCKCKPVVKGKFGLAYIVETPKQRCVQPVGWQIEFEDTPSRINSNCEKMTQWVNCPPIGNCININNNEVLCSCMPPNCMECLKTDNNCFCRKLCKPTSPCSPPPPNIARKCCCTCKCSSPEPICGCCCKQIKRRQVTKKYKKNNNYYNKQHKIHFSDTDMEEDESLDYIPQKDNNSKKTKPTQEVKNEKHTKHTNQIKPTNRRDENATQQRNEQNTTDEVELTTVDYEKSGKQQNREDKPVETNKNETARIIFDATQNADTTDTINNDTTDS